MLSAPLLAASFDWAAHTSEILIAAFLSMVPTFEGRYAVVTAIAMGMPAFEAYLLAFLCSSLPVPVILFLLRPVLAWFYTIKWAPIQKLAAWVERHMMKRAERMNKGQMLGLFLFVALPVPLTGVWTGSGIAALLKMKIRYALPVILLGNAVACLIMTLIATGVIQGLNFLL